MIKYIYKKLTSMRAKPFIMSKLNLWNFLNFKKFKDKSLNVLFTIKGLRVPRIKDFSVWLADPEVERIVTCCVFITSLLFAIWLYLGN